MKRIAAFFVIVTLLFTSCLVQQEITFNEDFSGSSTVKLDMSELFDVSMSMAGEEIPTNPDSLRMLKRAFLEDFLYEIDSAMNVGSEQGLKDLRFLADTADLKVNIMFAFDNIEALNTAFLKNYEENEPTPEFVINRKRNTIQYFVQVDTSQFGQMVQFETTMKFATPVKSCSHNEVSVQGNQAVIRTSDFKEATTVEITVQ